MLGPQFASVIVECLTSSKSETRAAATSLLEVSLTNGIVSTESFRKASEKLKPAKQRTVAPLVAKYAEAAPASEESENRRLPPTGGSTFESRLEAAPSPRKRQVVPTSAHKSGPRTAAARAPEKLTCVQDKPPTGNPLATRISSGKSSSRGIIWVEYPEEPQGSSLLGNLKKAWAHAIVPSSVFTLFPSAGIRKQDEAKDGCELLVQAVNDDRSDGTTFVRDQFDLVTKWVVYALCARETTIGLQALLSLIKDLFLYALDVNHDLSDSAALEIVPYIIEKSSSAKVRHFFLLYLCAIFFLTITNLYHRAVSKTCFLTY